MFLSEDCIRNWMLPVDVFTLTKHIIKHLAARLFRRCANALLLEIHILGTAATTPPLHAEPREPSDIRPAAAKHHHKRGPPPPLHPSTGSHASHTTSDSPRPNTRHKRGRGAMTVYGRRGAEDSLPRQTHLELVQGTSRCPSQQGVIGPHRPAVPRSVENTFV